MHNTVYSIVFCFCCFIECYMHLRLGKVCMISIRNHVQYIRVITINFASHGIHGYAIISHATYVY